MKQEKAIGQLSPPGRRYSTTEVVSSIGQGGMAHVNSRSPSYRDAEDKHRKDSSRPQTKIFDDASVALGYDSVPLIEIDALPRGGISLETNAVGRIQFGIPPETIKDSMLLGMEVPSVYIVPVERFCREMGPALGINLAEFEFPAYFNYFIRGKRCTLVVDSEDAERDIRTVFAETLLGPEEFRNHQKPLANCDEDFDPSFPGDSRPNFYKEFYNFRTSEASTDYKELTIDVLLNFCHFTPCETGGEVGGSVKLGVPPVPSEADSDRSKQGGIPIDKNSSRRRSVVGSSDDHLGAISEDKLDAKGGEELPRSTSDPDIMSPRSNHNRTMVMASDFGDQQHLSDGEGEAIRGNSRAECGFRRDSLTAQDGRRDSLVSMTSSKTDRQSLSTASVSPYDLMADDQPLMQDSLQQSKWMYSQARWLGEVATVYPIDATEEQKRTNSTSRVEIFKMAGGTEYIVHDVDENNVIIGKGRFSGSVRVPDELCVHGFIAADNLHGKEAGPSTANTNDDHVDREIITPNEDPQGASIPSFYPPSFGVTVLGNSHGFDKNGSTSGYVLWVNGRGIMIDPPPYSSATLEREGIRPQMIMAIIITHCHADHDAGAFQKVMTGSRVAIITTPTIYKSFIRKYSALSGLRPTLLRHSHRHRPAIIGQPLRFQGATFLFTYTLHTIPCISFKVQWRGRSIVFTGDHMNIPDVIDSLESKGVLSKGRADDLRGLPIQECDVLLHEAGAPPIHTPLHVLQALPEEVRARLYVVHTAAIPADSGLRVAPTGTAGTIRLDSSVGRSSLQMTNKQHSVNELSNQGGMKNIDQYRDGGIENVASFSDPSLITAASLQDGASKSLSVHGNYDAASAFSLAREFNGKDEKPLVPPLVFLRPTCVSDAWFILNLLSAVPFFSSLSYAHTMEVLEIAQVSVCCAGEVVVEGPRRPEMLCVVWEGALKEREYKSNPSESWPENDNSGSTIWYAGDWTGPVSLQPDVILSAHQHPGERLKDIVAMSAEGAKVIILMMKDLQRVLKSGSKLFRKYISIKQETDESRLSGSTSYGQSFLNDFTRDSLLDVLQCNSVLNSLTALQKRYLESLAEGPRFFEANSFLWRVGDQVDYAYLIVSGTATLGETIVPKIEHFRMNRRGSTGAIGGMMPSHGIGRVQPVMNVDPDKLLQNVHPNSEYARLKVTLLHRVEEMETEMEMMDTMDKYNHSAVFGREDTARNNRNRFANKVLARLYSRHAYTAGLVFSRGIFLSDTSRMVSGDLAHINRAAGSHGNHRSSFARGGGNADHHCHTSNLVAGSRGCAVMIFPRTTLVPFLDGNPGVLLGLLGTQVVV